MYKNIENENKSLHGWEDSTSMYTYITIRAVQCSSVHMCVCVCVCVQAELELHQAVLQMNVSEQIIIKVAVLMVIIRKKGLVFEHVMGVCLALLVSCLVPLIVLLCNVCVCVCVCV